VTPTCAAALGIALLLAPSLAEAQDRPSAALLTTTVGADADAQLGSSLDRVLRSRLDALGVVEMPGSVVLNLPDVQLALGCEGESQSCLSAVCAELGVRLLVLPNLDRIGTDLVLSVALFDRTGDEPARRVARRAGGDGAPSELLDQMDGLLAELFEIEPAPPPDLEQDVLPPVVPPEAPERPSVGAVDGGVLAAGLAVGALGLGLSGFGVGFGISSGQRADAYASAPIDSEMAASDALALYREASDQATLANIFLVTGGVALATAVVWTIAVLSAGGSSSESARLIPLATPDTIGLALSGALR